MKPLYKSVAYAHNELRYQIILRKGTNKINDLNVYNKATCFTCCNFSPTFTQTYRIRIISEHSDFCEKGSDKVFISVRIYRTNQEETGFRTFFSVKLS